MPHLDAVAAQVCGGRTSAVLSTTFRRTLGHPIPAQRAKAQFVLRRKRAKADRPVRVPLYPVVPLLFVLGELGIVLGAYFDPAMRRAAVVGVVWILAAGMLYFAFFRKQGSDGNA